MLFPTVLAQRTKKKNPKKKATCQKKSHKNKNKHVNKGRGNMCRKVKETLREVASMEPRWWAWHVKGDGDGS